MVMGALKQHAVGGGLTNSQAGMGGLLTSFLDSNKDGSVVGEVLGMFFKR